MREDSRSAVHYLEAVVRPEDVVVAVGSGSSQGLRYYGKSKLPLVTVRDERDLAQRLPELSKDHKRLWFVEIRFWRTDFRGRMEAMLGDAFVLVDQKQFPGVHIYGYQFAKQMLPTS
jgi:hypothetical protein